MRLLALLIKEWRLLLRDLHALAVLFLMPLVFVLLMAFALSDLNATTPATPAISLQAEASDNHSVFFAAALAAQIPLAESAPERVQLKVPADFAARLAEDGAELVQLIFPAKTPAIVRQQVRAAVNISLAQTQLHSFLLGNELLSTEQSLAEQLALVQQQTQSHIAEQDQGSQGQLFARANPSQHSVPAWLIFGMFFVMLPMANTLLKEQQSGTLLRLKCAGLPTLTLAAGKCLPYFVINLLQFAVLLLVSYFALPALGLAPLQLHGSLVAWLLLALSIAACCCGFGFFIASLVRSNEQALMLSGGCNIILAAIGGIMVPKAVMPVAMQQLANVSPMSWALDGFLTLLVAHGNVADIAPNVARLLLFALLAFGLAYVIYHHKLSRIKWTALY
jgi:ABC-2 type transport system permease protein